MKIYSPHTHTMLFRMVSTFVFILVLMATLANGHLSQDYLLVNLIDQLNSKVFGTDTGSSWSANKGFGQILSPTCLTGHDPSPDLPLPPPPTP